MSNETTLVIEGMENGVRIDSRILESRIQQAVADGCRKMEIIADGQHGIGGRLWSAGSEPVHLRIKGSPGQRVGSMGFPGTRIEVDGPASDDLGWLNAGAHIIVHGHATNGVANAMAQGKIYVGGDIGARGMTMTKQNPRFDPPELWVLGGVGDFFAEFMAGGVAVICGYEARAKDNVLGYRPCVGMVGGKVFFRGPHRGFSERDAFMRGPDDEEWEWLKAGMADFLETTCRPALLPKLKLLPKIVGDRGEWRVIVAKKPYEKKDSLRNIKKFREDNWDRELGKGGLIGDLTSADRSPIPVIVTGELRRFVPIWENEKYLPPCQAACPTGIPVRKRWDLIRKGKVQEAVDLALQFTPFPATICGYLCPNLCMQSCTRNQYDLEPIDTTILGQASLNATVPPAPPSSGKRIAVIGGGPSGLSVAWQLRMKGHEAVIHDARKQLGGKITGMIPRSRIPDEVLEHEIHRMERELPHVALKHPLTTDEFRRLREKFDVVVIAVGAQKGRVIPVPGHERVVPALYFLRDSRTDCAKVGKKVVIIGAGNVGCDAASEAFRLGAESVVMIDVQKPAASGKERKNAEAAGATFLWPRFTKQITETGVELTDGEVLPADTVIMAVGDQPDLSFLPEEIKTERGFITVDENQQTSVPGVYAVGDSARLGLLTEAIGSGRRAARAIDDMLRGREEKYDQMPTIPIERVKVQYYDPRLQNFGDIVSCATSCASCGGCRDCGMCETACPQNAISRKEGEDGRFEYVSDDSLCIGCGACSGVCPTGVWNLVPNAPMESEA